MGEESQAQSRANLQAHEACLPAWESVCWATVFAVYLTLFLEWLFFVTTPSFLAPLVMRQKLAVALLSPWPILVVTLPVLLLARVAGSTRVGARLRPLLPAIVLLVLFLLLLDNFTNTVFGIGIEKSSGWQRWAYVAVIVLLGGAAWRVTAWSLQHLQRRAWRWVGVALLLLSLAATALPSRPKPERAGRVQLDTNLPSILLLSGDGLEASNLSCYGYERDTTPFLRELVPASLFCENAFPNSAHTAGGIVSVLTGRFPTQTRVVYRPDVLHGVDAYRHLPGILRSLGYRTFHVSGRHYADAYDLNVRGGFDRSTFRSREVGGWGVGVDRIVGQSTAYFLEHVADRVASRLLHVAGRSAMGEAFTEVTGEDLPTNLSPAANDLLRIADLCRFMRASDGPVFAQMHLYVTHGPRFTSPQRVFSKGPQSVNWMTDFYDDAILAFDSMVAAVFDSLRAMDRLDNTVVVLWTDHGTAFSMTTRVPLLFRFPGANSARRVCTNVQNVDIAPTLLDYLGVEKPDWMVGASILSEDPDPKRPVFSAGLSSGAVAWTDQGLAVSPERLNPPFYSMGQTTLLVCNRAFTADWGSRRLLIRDVADHTLPCAAGDLPNAKQAEALLFMHLEACGWDLSSVERPLLPARPSAPRRRRLGISTHP